MRALPGRATRNLHGDPSAAPTRDGTGEDQRRRILRATAELVAKRGYSDVSVELIVKRARVSFKTFYKHFASKADAFLALFDAYYEDAYAEVRAVLGETRGASWPQQVALALRVFFERIAADPIAARACIVEGPTIGPMIHDRYERASKAFAPLFRAGRRLNPEGAELPETLEDTLAGSIFWSAYQRLIVGEVDQIEALLPEAIELVLRPYLGESEAIRISREALAGAGLS